MNYFIVFQKNISFTFDRTCSFFPLSPKDISLLVKILLKDFSVDLTSVMWRQVLIDYAHISHEATIKYIATL